MSGDGMRTGIEYDLEAQREYTRKLQGQVATLTAELEAARALLAHREGIWQEALAKRDRSLEAARRDLGEMTRFRDDWRDLSATASGHLDEVRHERDAARRDIGLRQQALEATALELDGTAAALSLAELNIGRLVALIIHDVGDGTWMCDICHRAPDFEVKHTKDCPMPAILAATAQPASATEPDAHGA